MNSTQDGDAAPPTTVNGGLHSPMPYLFGGLAAMLVLIGIALFILICSFQKYSSRSSTGDEEKSVAPPVYIIKPEMEPKIVVIMAGDNMPTYLAQPILVADILGNNDEKV
ncbi:hypothetical protein LIER_34163 [Lithospermum erythrorhizon]|uniref:Uncharacterized protein n=1 Tax=Lithospermum erythrorhizon TaxID=34254 RepID=A0AAV3S1X7_LITER